MRALEAPKVWLHGADFSGRDCPYFKRSFLSRYYKFSGIYERESAI